MMNKFTTLLATLIGGSLLLTSSGADALSIKEFNEICDSTPMACHEIPFVQAYVGGALDLLAMLDEETAYLEEIYCLPKQEFLATTPIIKYFQAQKNERPSRNAMMLLIQYVEENGRC